MRHAGKTARLRDNGIASLCRLTVSPLARFPALALLQKPIQLTSHRGIAFRGARDTPDGREREALPESRDVRCGYGTPQGLKQLKLPGGTLPATQIVPPRGQAAQLMTVGGAAVPVQTREPRHREWSRSGRSGSVGNSRRSRRRSRFRSCCRRCRLGVGVGRRRRTARPGMFLLHSRFHQAAHPCPGPFSASGRAGRTSFTFSSSWPRSR
jgi:hypothetical protein